MAEKRSGKELQIGSRIEPISQFIEDELERLKQKKPDKEPKTAMEPLNKVFRTILDL